MARIDEIRKEDYVRELDRTQLSQGPKTQQARQTPRITPVGPQTTRAPREDNQRRGGVFTQGTPALPTVTPGLTPRAVPPVEPKVPEVPKVPNPVIATVNKTLNNPTEYLTDTNLNQEYTTQAVVPEEIQDPTQFNVSDPGNLEATLAAQQGELQAAANVEVGTIAAETVQQQGDRQAADAVQVQDFSASLIDPADLTKSLDELAKVEPMKAASMARELDGLLQGMEEGNVPVWARPAVTQVEQMLAARGISASSVGRDALFNAIIQSAMPIAQQDATFKQDSYKTNYTAKVQAVMSDANMEFAAKQFNANSINQTNQFRAQLQTQVDSQNAGRQDAMSQFNSQLRSQTSQFNVSAINQASSTQVQLQANTDLQNASRQDAMTQAGAQLQAQNSQFNAAQTNALTQSSAELQAQRAQFNANMSTQLEQSNVNWRRQVNSANTAGVNAVNQANVQNAFNLSNQALTFLWQETRDEAHWEFQATETEKDRRNQLEASILANESAMGGEIGRTIESILNGSNFVSSFLNSWGE